MKTKDSIRLVYEPVNPAAIRGALDLLDRNGREQARCIAIIKPEVECLLQDSSHGMHSVEILLDEYLLDPSKRKTQLYLALSICAESKRKMSGESEPLFEDAQARVDAIRATCVALDELARIKAEQELQAWFEPAQIGYVMPRCKQVAMARGLLERCNSIQWGTSIARLAADRRLGSAENPAAEIVRLYRAIIDHFESIQNEVNEIAALVEAA